MSGPELETDSNAFQRLRKVIQLLAAGPVAGPDRVPVRICLNDSIMRYYLLPGRPPGDPMPRTWMVAIASERTLTGQASRILTVGGRGRFVYVDAHTLTGPPLRMRRRFGRWSVAEAHVLALAEDIRTRGSVVLD